MHPFLGATTTLDRQSDLRADSDYIDSCLTAPDSRFFVVAGAKLVIDSTDDRSKTSLRWFSKATLDKMGVPLMDTVFLGQEPKTNVARFAVLITEHFARHAPNADGKLQPHVELRSLASQGSMPVEDLQLAAQAIGIRNWHEETRCCGRCGGSMTNKNGGWKRRCWACKNEIFPRIDPVVIMAVTHGDKLLLAHEDRFADTMYSTIAGYLEPGDDIEHAVRRETLEEVGLTVGEVSYHGSQPWPFPHNLMIGCMAEAIDADIVVNPNEVVAARWFGVDEVQQMLAHKHPEGLWVPGQQSMAHTLITRFVQDHA
ncbi:MAG: NAD(+) diphosphatase [Pseudomonadota bacterium]